MWLVVHLAFMTGFKNRFAAVLNWTVAFLGRDRRQRTITEQEVFARTRALEQPGRLWPRCSRGPGPPGSLASPRWIRLGSLGQAACAR